MTRDPSSETPDAAIVPAGCGSIRLLSMATIAKPHRKAETMGLGLGKPTEGCQDRRPSLFILRRYRLPLDRRVADKTIPPAKFSFYQMFGRFTKRTQFCAQPVDHHVDRPIGRWPVLAVQRFGECGARLDLPGMIDK